MWPEEGAGEIRNHPNGWHLYGLTVHGSQSTFPCIYSLILLSAQNMLVLEVKDSLRSNENIIPTYCRSELWLVWNEVTDQRKLFSSVEKLSLHFDTYKFGSVHWHFLQREKVFWEQITAFMVRYNLNESHTKVSIWVTCESIVLVIMFMLN